MAGDFVYNLHVCGKTVVNDADELTLTVEIKLLCLRNVASGIQQIYVLRNVFHQNQKQILCRIQLQLVYLTQDVADGLG